MSWFFASASMAAAPIPVTVATVSAPKTAQYDLYPAQIVADRESPLHFEVSGIVAKRWVHAGSRVAQGQVLVSLNDRTAQLQLRQATRGYAAAEVQYQQAKKQFDMKQRLYQQKHLSPLQWSAEQQQYSRVEATYHQAKAERDLAQHRLQLHVLTAPFAGVVRSTQVEQGQSVSPAQPVVELASNKQAIILFVTHQQRASLKKGMTVVVSDDRTPVQLAQGTVDEVAVVPTHADSYRVKILIAAHQPSQFHIGQSVEVKIPIAGSKQWLVFPVSALVAPAVMAYGDKTGQVWRLDHKTMRVHPLRIRVEYLTYDHVWVSQGLQRGDQVVTARQSQLFDQATVRVVADGETKDSVAKGRP